METKYIEPKPSIPNCNSGKRRRRPSSEGFTLIEIMVALVVTMIVMAAAYSITIHVRNLYLLDQARTTLNQNLRGGMEVIAADIRQAGEQLPNSALNPHNIPPLQIINGTSGASDVVVLTRNDLSAVLPVCADIHAGSSTNNVKVADPGPHTATGCAPVPDTNGDGWPDNMDTWRNYRINNGGSVQVYIYDPQTGNGEFFTYDAEDASTFHIHRAAGSWQYSYPASDHPQVYALDQRRYFLNGNYLRLQINGVTNYDVSTDFTDFQAEAIMQDGSVLTSFGSGSNWLNVIGIQVTLDGQTSAGHQSYSNSLTMRLFPRNILSN